jgi:CspA family cold shock protein
MDDGADATAGTHLALATDYAAMAVCLEVSFMRGTVVRMIRDRGFGFVRCEDGTEVFFHHSSLPRGVFDTIQEGQEMEFDIENDVRGRGQRATNVELINSAYNPQR